MQHAYLSGDPYLTFAKQANAVPPDATKQSHTTERELFKSCALGVQFGMEEKTMAARIGQPPIVARDLLRSHRETYRAFWRWSDAAVDCAMLNGSICTVFGWPIRIGERPNPRSLRNFPCQANGAEMLRLACCFAIEQGIELCAPMHDAVLICAPLDQIEHDVHRMQACMLKASRIVLDGFELRADANVIKHPFHYSDPRGRLM
jgi:DNA polymerase-1